MNWPLAGMVTVRMRRPLPNSCTAAPPGPATVRRERLAEVDRAAVDLDLRRDRGRRRGRVALGVGVGVAV